jgi:hypothetical protein
VRRQAQRDAALDSPCFGFSLAVQRKESQSGVALRLPPHSKGLSLELGLEWRAATPLWILLRTYLPN